MATGVTGDPVHSGSWFGLPDFGVTEWLSNTTGNSNRTAQGGSDLIPNQTTPPSQITSQYDVYNDPAKTEVYNPKPTNTTTKTTTGGGGGTTQTEQQRRLAAWRAAGNTGDLPVGWNPDTAGGQSANDWNNMLNDAYQPFLQTLDQWGNAINQGKAEDEALVGKQYSDTQQNLENQQKNEQAGLDEQGRQLWESFRKAFGSGAQNYAQRLRGLVNLYGLGNSTGQTMAQLLSNKQAEVEGNLNEQNLQGQRSLALEGVKLSRYIDDKKNQLDTWKNQTMNSIAQNVRDKLNQINQMRGEAEINKTNAKIALLQQTMAAQKQVEAQDQAFRQNLAQFAVQQLANVQQDNFDPAQIPGVVAQTLQQLQGISSGNPAQGYTLSPIGKTTDEFAGLTG